MKKKLLSAFLSIILMFAVFPTTVFAVDTVTVDNGMAFTSGTTAQDITDAWGEGTATIEKNNDGSYTVKLLKNITLKKGANLPVTFGKSLGGDDQPMMILDLNGCVLSGQTIVVSNYGNLTIKDSKGGGKVVYDGGAYLSTIQNAGNNLIIEGGTFECKGAVSAISGGAISGTQGSTTTINGGSFNSENSGVLTTFGKLIVNSGTVTGKYGIVAKQSSQEGVASNVEIPYGSTVVVDATDMAFVVATDGEGPKPEGNIVVNGGIYNASAVVGVTGGGDVTNNVAITGGSYNTDPGKFVKDEKAVAEITSVNETNKQFFVGDSIVAKIEKAEKGDQIVITRGDVEVNNVPDGVIISNLGDGNVVVNDEQINEEPVTICNHTWGEPVWIWNDKTDVTAEFICTKDNTHKVTETAQVTSSVTKEATCTEMGETTYCATVVFDGVQYSDKIVIADINKKDHTYVNGICTVCGAEDLNYEEAKTPVIIKGANSIWNKGDKDGLSFTSDAEYKDFIKVQVDGKDLESSQYTVKEGSTIVTLKSSYLETLSIGKHTLAIVSDNGTATTQFSIEKAEKNETVKTGDDSSLWAVVLLILISGVGVGVVPNYRRKKDI